MKHALPLALLLTLPTAAAQAQNLTNNGATISLTNGAVLWVGGTLQNTSGTLDLSSGSNQLYVGGDLTSAAGATLQAGTASTVTLNGAATQQLDLAGARLYNLTVSNTGGGVTLPTASNADVAGRLTLSSGMVAVSPSSVLRLLDGATLTGEQIGRYVWGNLAAVRTSVPAGTATSFANGFVLTPATGLSNLTVTRRAGLGAAQTSYGTSGSGAYKGIDQIWATSTAVSGTVQLSWLSDNDNGLTDFRQSQAWARTAAPVAGSDWSRISPSQDATATRTVTGTIPPNISFSFFTVSTADSPLGSAPLPVTLTNFTAAAQGPDVLLRWTTASEVNNDRFEVEVSPDGRTFRRIGQVTGRGSSNQPQAYQLLDPAVARYATSLVYYRLRQVDRDGTAAYSTVRTVAVSAQPGLALFPNPTTQTTTLTGAQPGTMVTVFDAVGRQVLRAMADAAGTATLVLPAGRATGVYVVRVGATVLRLTVE
ncbi:T9SS type A sorting domain-containing protein [Hymenobacter endophyticus]|uniref:T9SS type A sorting domain-containing protein n=1 Tax=Hymenobacter endophyticus TaxID=3076335 RepID=A0ABU3TJD3_9BACT|nr:T9SS type A sorting domain-containing protein [Hymenobacter endophyticus]MDU0371485.1 T9SS type A sorting domain-containing protein [Hymenobacter endophyticus]